MNRHRILSCAIALAALVALPAFAADSGATSYKLAAAFELGGDGGWDFATLSADGGRLYVTRTTHTMVLNVATGKLVADIGGQQGSHGVALVPEAHRGFISDGKDGSVQIFDLKSDAVIGKVPAAAGADAVIYDRASNRVLVFCSGANQMVALAPDVDPANGKAAATLDLGGSPEFAAADGNGKVFVNIVDKDEVAVVDTRAMKVVARWPTGPGKRPTAISMDRDTRRLFIGCRNNILIVMNADDGKVVADFPIGAFVDATAFRDGLIFASCGAGTLTIIRELSGDKFEPAQVLKTELGARTMAVDAVGGMIYMPTADLMLPPASASGPHPRPVPVPGTFRVLVVTQ